MVPVPDSPEKDCLWVEVKPRIIKDTWKSRLMKQTGYMPKPQPAKIHPDRAKKKIMTKTLYNAGWSTKQLSIWFKEPPLNILRWSKIPTPDRLLEFERDFQLAMKDYDNRALFKTKERMMEIIPEEKSLDKLVKAAEFFKGTPVKNQTNIQNNIYGDLVKKFSPDINN